MDRLYSDRTRGNGFTPKEERFRLNMKKFSTVRVVRYWHRLPREVVDAPSLETFKVMLEGLWAPDVAVGVRAHCGGVGLDSL